MNFLIIGGGSIGKRHLKNLIGLGHSVAVCEPAADRAKKIESELGVKVFTDLAKALAGSFDAALITNPNVYHLDTAIQAAQSGCHLFIEKPVSHTLEGLDELLSLVEQKGLKTLVGCNWKFHPSFKLMKQLLDRGEIGRVISFSVNFGQYLPDWHPWEDYRKGYSANRSLGGGILLDSHEFDYLQWFLGPLAKVVCLNGRYSDLEIDTEDVAEVVVETEQRALGNVHLDYVQRLYRRFYHFYGTEGTIEWDYQTKKVMLYTARDKQWQYFDEDRDYDLNQMYVDEMKHFIAVLQGQEASVNDVRQARSVLDTIMRAKGLETVRR